MILLDTSAVIESWLLKTELKHPHFDFQYRRIIWHACVAFGSWTCGLISESRNDTGARQRQRHKDKSRTRSRSHARMFKSGEGDQMPATYTEHNHVVLHEGSNLRSQIWGTSNPSYGVRTRCDQIWGFKSGGSNPSYGSGTRPRSHPP